MRQVIIENPVINSPFREPEQHYRFTDDGITDEVVTGKRISASFIASRVAPVGGRPIIEKQPRWEPPMKIPRNIPATEQEVAKFCRRHHIRCLSFFGSVLRDDFGPDSDVDVLVEFEPGHTPGLDVYDIEQELSHLCGGRRIDMVNPKYLNRWLKDEILRTAETAYAQG